MHEPDARSPPFRSFPSGEWMVFERHIKVVADLSKKAFPIPPFTTSADKSRSRQSAVDYVLAVVRCCARTLRMVQSHPENIYARAVSYKSHLVNMTYDTVRVICTSHISSPRGLDYQMVEKGMLSTRRVFPTSMRYL